MSLDVDVRASAEMSTALQSMNNMTSDMDDMENSVDPDAQGNLTDFLDFTEYLPSDMIRSLTLVKSLNQLSMDSSNALHDLTKHYGMLPNPSSHIHQNPRQLRVDISEDVDEAVNSRILSVNEAARMTENVDRHYKRAQHILEKLRSMAETYPPSREASPSFQPNVSPRVARTPKIMLRLDGGRFAANNSGLRIPKHRAPRITVPGEVLAPYDFEFENYVTETEDIESEEENDIPRHTPARRTPGLGGKKMKVSKVTKIKGPKPPRAPRPPGVMGTNVHSAVAGISTSNALAKLKPPPDDAVPGSADAPWLQLTAWELAKLRKRMKKNAVWNPSDTMIARELKQLGRGIEAYRKAKMHADESGQPFEQTQAISADDGEGNQITVEGAISADALAKEDVQLSNRGMKLNEAKKLKRETQAKELAQAAAEVDAATNKLKGLFAKTGTENTSATPTATSKEAPAKTPSRRKPTKRKREDSIVDIETPKNEAEVPSPATNANKKMKLETPVPAPLAPLAPSVPSVPPVPPVPSVQQASAAPALPPHPNMSKTSSEILPAPDSSNTSVATVTTTTTVPLRSSPSKKSSTPILPPTKGKKDVKKDINPTTVITAAQERQASNAPTPTPPPPSTTLLASRRPPSRGKAASAEPTSSIGKDRPRRPSTVHNTPAPEQTPSRARTPSRPSSRRGKRPAPGPITAGSEGSTAVSVGKRKAAPRKKPGSKKQLKAEEKEEKEVPQVWDEFDDEGVIIDPNEPRYCLCNRVSFGVMICCENKDCEKEWFHLECVGLTDVPPRTTKWYCPDCRVTLRIGEKGEVTARGKKK